MPNKVEQAADGNLSVELETGEKFTGDALAVTEKMAEAHVNTKKWGADFKAKYETLQATPPPNTTPPPDVNLDPQQKQLQEYLVSNVAKGLGYDNSDVFRADLKRIKGTTEEINNQLVAAQFMALAPDFPNSPEAIAALSKKMDDMHLNFDTQSMIAAHSLLVRENAGDKTKGYAPLTETQQTATWEANLRASNRPVAPPIPNRNSPEISDQQNPWDSKVMSLDQLRQAAIRQQLEQK